MRRRTKVRGFQASAEELSKKLQDENVELRRSLQYERDQNHSLRLQLAEFQRGFTTRERGPANELPPVTVGTSSVGSEPLQHSKARNGNALLTKHMGRLVLDDNGVGRFAGSTTGVHFVLSVQDAVRQRGFFDDWFPESCFCLHLLHPSAHSLEIPLPRTDPRLEVHDTSVSLKALLDYPLAFYIGHFRLYTAAWSALCPVIAVGDLTAQFTMLYSQINAGPLNSGDEECAVLFSCMMVIAINHASLPREQLEPFVLGESMERFMRLANKILPCLVSGQRLASIQGLALLSFLYHLTGQHLLMAHMRGLLVQLAMSTGLHRHARRFKFPVGEIEMRKRLWWWIYLVDK